jgi:integrase
MSRRSAETILRHVEELTRAAKAGVKPEVDSVKWSMDLEGRLRDRLVACGLITGTSRRQHDLDRRFLEPFIDRYIEERTDARPSTITNYRHAKRWLVEFFGPDRPLAEITPADCDRFQRFLNDGERLALSTAEKILKRAKTMFRHAVRDRILEENPFEDLKLSGAVNRDRDAFIDRDKARWILNACPDADWKAIFSLSRFGGLRAPSEVLTLKWDDIDWDSGQIRIDSPKTGLRTCPLFPELAEVLGNAYNESTRHHKYVVRQYRGAGKNLRTRLIRIVSDAGLKPWPKLFVNLRASRRTELQEQFPDHVVNSWLGHSSRVAEKHYLQITPDHWAKAIGGNAGGNIRANQQGSTAISGGQNAENLLPDGSRFPEILALAPRVVLYANTGSLNWEPFVSTTYVDRPNSCFTHGNRFRPFLRLQESRKHRSLTG